MEKHQKRYRAESNEAARYSKVRLLMVIEILQKQRVIWERVRELAAIEKLNREREQELAAIEKLQRKAAKSPFLMFVLQSCSLECQ